MQVTLEQGEGLERRLRVAVPEAQIDSVVDKRLRELSRTLRLDGFRPGKIPVRVVKQRFGEQVKQEAIGELIQETFMKAAQEQGVAPAGEPKIELDEQVETGSFGYVAIFDVMPEIELADMAEIEIIRPTAEISDEDLENMIDKLRKQRTVYSQVDRPAQDGDTLTVDFVGKMDGEAFEGGAGNDVKIVLGSNSMIEGFESGLLGASAGDERNLELKFPEDYRAEHLAGKASDFEIKIKMIEEPELPELNDEFFRAFGVETGQLDDFKAEVRGNMRRELKQKLRSLGKERVLSAMLAKNEILVPKDMAMQEAQRLHEQTVNEMKAQGQNSGVQLPPEVFLQEAERRVALGLMIGHISRNESIQVDPDRVKATIEEIAEPYEKPEDVIGWYYQNQEQLRSVENLVLEDQVVDWVLAHAKVTEESLAFDAVMSTK